MDKVKKIVQAIRKFFINNDVDVLIFIGTFFIAFATYRINFIAFLYLIGAIFIGFGLLISKSPKKK